MALDGLMLHAVCDELKQTILNSRVEKIYQPSKEELVIGLRTAQGSVRLLICAKSDTARIHLTGIAVENPMQPPMLCMLLRKLIGSARLVNIRQNGFERAAYLDFDTSDEFGDPITITVAVEIMGRHSNIIIVDNNQRIVDSIKRVPADKSSVRQVLPGLCYAVPPSQHKIAITEDENKLTDAILMASRDVEISKLICETIEGTSPLIAREIAYNAFGGRDMDRSSLSPADAAQLKSGLAWMKDVMENGKTVPTMLVQGNQPKDFTFIPIRQYGELLGNKVYPSLSALLDSFYGERDAQERMKQKMSDFSRTITSKIERIHRKLDLQYQELELCKNREEMRIKGDLISSSLHLMEKGMDSITLENYYDENLSDIKIELDPRLTPAKNAQKYYKDYRRADTAEKMLKELIESAQKELEYLDSVYDLMERAKSEAELESLRQELAQSGYLRVVSGKKAKKPQALPPLKYVSDDGFVILSGRNNLQNDRLTLKDSRKDDIWFHTQKIPGSHTVIVSQGKQVPNKTIEQAAVIAATNSKAAHSSKVAVDYTVIKNVKKQANAKPGMVIYENYQTAIVDPDEQLLSRLGLK